MARGEAMGVARGNACGVPKGKPRQVASGETTMGVARGKASGPTGGVFGCCSDHFETPSTPEGWFCLSAVNKWWMGRQWSVGEPKGGVFGFVAIFRHRLRQRSGSGCQGSTMVDGSAMVGW